MIMSEDEDHLLLPFICCFFFFLLVSGKLVSGDYSLDTDKQVLLQLKSFLVDQNHDFNQGVYAQWDPTAPSCTWAGISCGSVQRVVGIDLSGGSIAGKLFANFSALTELSYLDLSNNTIGGDLPEDIGRCWNLKMLNLSHNFITGELNLTGLVNLETLDLSFNRLASDIRLAIPMDCSNLFVANVSTNNFTGDIYGVFQSCLNLKYLDLSTNNLSGGLWPGFDGLEEISLSENAFSGEVSPLIFTENCSLLALDLSGNQFSGEFPGEISNCKNLEMLSLSGNRFTGLIPEEIGSLTKIQALYLGNNNFSRTIPESFISLAALEFLDLSRNNFRGNMQTIFRRLTQVRFLLLHTNSYTGGIYSSGVLSLSNLRRLDLSYNKFSGHLPINVSRMTSLQFLMLAHNQFSGAIPDEYGDLRSLQALDLSFNSLVGSIPRSLGNLSSLLWLMLANNSLTGEIPRELGNCSSLLWLNLANNQLSGGIPPELTKIGVNAMPTFMLNRASRLLPAGSGECLAMMRWIPADYPPFNFAYTLLTRKRCRNLWDRILKGYGLFSVCLPGSNVRRMQNMGYIQLTGNQLSGEIPETIGNMKNFSMIHLGHNRFQGMLPSDIGELPLTVLNISNNFFSGNIPSEIGNIRSLQNLDLSYNNFSGSFPLSLIHLNELTKFNISYNPLISGSVPEKNQFSTFEEISFLGDPLLQLPGFMRNSSNKRQMNHHQGDRRTRVAAQFPHVIVLIILGSFIFGVVFFICCCILLLKRSRNRQKLLSGETFKAIHLNEIKFTHSDIVKATRGFSNDRIIGKGGSGIVYRGVLSDGKQIAVKKLQADGIDGEREFWAEMDALKGNGGHQNLVPLYGWFFNGSEKLLVYEFMKGGSLEDVITDGIRFNWRRRLQVAVDVAQALMFLHHECYPSIVHRDVKASNVLLDKNGTAKVTDFGLARVMDAGKTHYSTAVAGTIGYVAPEYGQTWQATTKGDVYSYGVLVMELAAARRALDGGEECLLEWATRVMGDGSREKTPALVLVSGVAEGAGKMWELLRIGILCTMENPNRRPNMKEVLTMLFALTHT